MKSDVEKKLAALREDYKKNIPNKIMEIEELWQSVAKNWDAETVATFHRKSHSLVGSAGMYGFEKLSVSARNLEIVLKTLLKQSSLLSGQAEKISQLLQELQQEGETSLAGAPVYHDVSSAKIKLTEKLIYLFDEESQWGKKLISEAERFDCQIKLFESTTSLLKAYQQKPGILLINMDLLDDVLEKQLKEMIDAPIFLFTTHSEFATRLKAVRLNAQAFLIKPFPIEDLINQVDNLIKKESETYRVLIIDDEMEVAQYYASILEQANMQTHIVTKSTDADTALHEFKPDVLLMDLYMPECSGLELAAIIRQQTKYESIPIIFLSSEEDKLTQLNAMKLGADDFVTKATDPKCLILAIKNRANRYKTLSSMMIKDNLTGVFNHSFILYQLDIELKDALRTHRSLSVVLIDIDKFKNVNDTYGHMAGDHILRSLCLILIKRLRGVDIVGRYGGEEFLILLPDTDATAAQKVANEIREQFTSLTFSWGHKIFNVTFSAGISYFPDFYTAKDIIEGADKALQKAKESGRNRVELATPAGKQ